MRSMVMADWPDYELSQFDLARAEAMVVAWDAQDEFLISAFTQRKDVHRARACLIFRDWDMRNGLPPDDLMASINVVCSKCAAKGDKECNHSERYMGKQAGHAFSYLLGVKKFVYELLPTFDIFITESEGKRIQQAVVSQAIKNWQDDSMEQLRKTPRIIYNACGRFREFYGYRDQAMLRDLLSWKAQSVVSDITNDAMVALRDDFAALPLIESGDYKIPRYAARIVTQTHDSVLVCHYKPLRAKVYSLAQERFRRVLTFHGRELVIPLDGESASNWSMKEAA
jgi:DNA polymerase I-like protein with 3'-5' exonuclease and polymerase domains